MDSREVVETQMPGLSDSAQGAREECDFDRPEGVFWPFRRLHVILLLSLSSLVPMFCKS